jgi:hypothetical protein
MDQATFTDVQLSNLTLLLTIRDGVLKDCAGTCSRFLLDATQAQRIAELGVPQIMALVTNVGEASLFSPRSDLLDLLAAPLPLVRTLAAAHAPRPLC